MLDKQRDLLSAVNNFLQCRICGHLLTKTAGSYSDVRLRQ